MKKNVFRLAVTIVPVVAIALSIALAQNAPAPQSAPAAGGAHATLPPLPPPQNVPKPGPAGDGPYEPLALMPGGVVVTLFPPGSPYLKMDRIKEAEVYNMSGAVPGRVSSIVNIHNPSIEFHSVERGLNTGAVIILAAGGGHNTLNVGGEACDFVPFFYNYGVNTVILRNRLRRDGYNPQTDEVYDAQQAVRMVRAHAKDWNLDPNKIGIMGFSAGAELSAPTGVLFEDFDKKNSDPGDPLAGISSRPDFVGIIYPGPSPFARGRTAPPIPRNTPPAFIAGAASGDSQHAQWALDYFQAMLNMRIPNIEIHLYAQGKHPGDKLDDGSSMSGGLTDRNNIPYGTWQYRMIDWMKDLGMLQKPGVETKAAKDITAYLAAPAPGAGRGGFGGSGFGGRGGSGRGGPAASGPGR
jgi:endo-1,4-beta-xylanase